MGKPIFNQFLLTTNWIRLCQLFLASIMSRHILLATTTKTNTSGNILFYIPILCLINTFLVFFCNLYI